ncbi:hypothetical protein [Burkholderia contaminans]|uniref:hypothetical protein n=1 Tax=Burkholderia contaminans TaxID=488447 RepID=UPI002D7F36C2|nr:hypothetical protein [Burkholderia contaminans]
MLQINRIRCREIVLAAMLGMLSLDALAVMEQPAGRDDTAQAIRDRGTPVGDVVIFDRALGGYDTSDFRKWGAKFVDLPIVHRHGDRCMSDRSGMGEVGHVDRHQAFVQGRDNRGDGRVDSTRRKRIRA